MEFCLNPVNLQGTSPHKIRGIIVHGDCLQMLHRIGEKSYPESSNAMKSPEGAAISLYTLASPLTYPVYSWSVH